jgi:hypothetical protein
VPAPFQVKTLYDAIDAFSGGVDQGSSPLEIPINEMSLAVNTTVRGQNVTHRPAYVKRAINFINQNAQLSVQQSYFQGHCQATDDAGNASLVMLISQRVFQVLIQGNVMTCNEIQIPGGPLMVNGKPAPIAWLWQSERWVIIQDGTNPPIFVDLNGGVGVTPVLGIPNFGTATRSNSNAVSNFSTTVSVPFAVVPGTSTSITTGPSNLNNTSGTTDDDGGVTTYNLYQSTTSYTATTTLATGQSVGIPAVGQINTIEFANTSSLNPLDTVTISGLGQFIVQSVSGQTVTLQNQNAVNAGGNIKVGTTVTWSHIGQQMPAGCMGAYVMGRNWLALPGRLTFIAGDIVDGASGTQAYAFRDSVLNVTENSYIVGGGTFSIPASGGEQIQAMLGLATLNVALGQGPLQVFTQYRVFSCNAPVDRLTWQTITNPILTVSLIGAGAEGQNSTVMANGDPLFRSVDGIRSLTFSELSWLSPRNLWQNSPLSFEVSDTLANDNQTLLQWGSSIVFDNRFLSTTGPVMTANGVYWTGLVPINFDTTSTLKKKSEPVWDAGVWNGMNILQMSTGEVQGIQRAFAFCVNTSSANAGIELYEILPSTGPLSATADSNGVSSVPITWQFATASLRFKVPKGEHVYMALNNGEVWVDNLIGTVGFLAEYLPDQYPVWQTWQQWTTTQTKAAPYAASGNPDFLPRQGLGTPSAKPCDISTNRPLRNFFTLQVRFTITGHCTFLGAFFEAETQPMPTFAKVVCPLPSTPTPMPPTYICGQYGGNMPNFTPSVSCMLATDVSNGNLWQWYLGMWHLIMVSGGTQQVFFGLGNPTVPVPTLGGVYFDITNPAQIAMWSGANGVWTELIA